MNIVIIEQNEIYRESLKTVLNQIEEFKVVFDSDNICFQEEVVNTQINLILIDYSLGKSKCNEITKKAFAVWGATVKFLFMTDFKEDCSINGMNSPEMILKNSSKSDFDKLIRETLNLTLSRQ